MPAFDVLCPHCNKRLGAPGKQNLCNHCWEPLDQEQIKQIMETTIEKHQSRMRGE